MENDEEVRRWLSRMLLLLPGFLCLGIARYIGQMGEFEEFELTVYSLGISLLIFVLAATVSKAFTYLGGLLRPHIEVQKYLGYSSLGFGLMVICIAVMGGVIGGKMYGDDSVLGMARKGLGSGLRMSTRRPLSVLLRQNSLGVLKEGRPTGIRERESWLEIELKDGEVLAGYPMLFRTSSDQRAEIFLSPACRGSGQSTEPIEGPGVLVSEEETKYIIFSGQLNSRCYNLWAKRQ